MVATESIAREKLGQAVEILGEQDVDLWLTFVRESLLTRDPSLDLVAGTYCAWQAAFLVSRSGEQTAIVGRFDAPNVVGLGAYDEVVPYDENIRPLLRDAIERLDPESIAINYSESDPAADGLTHGMWLVLQETLAGTPYADRLASSEAIVNALRGRKSPAEIERIRAAVRETEEIFEVASRMLAPDLSELEIAAADARRGQAARPRVRVGAGALPGGQRRSRQGGRPQQPERAPDETRRAPAHGLRRLEGGLLQRSPARLVPPRRGRDRGAAGRRRGVGRGLGGGRRRRRGAAARRGRLGGRRSGSIAPRRCRLPGADVLARPPARPRLRTTAGRFSGRAGTATGTAPYGLVEEGNVYTLEFGTAVPNRGYVGLEEDVLVTADGIEWLSTPQRELWLVS